MIFSFKPEREEDPADWVDQPYYNLVTGLFRPDEVLTDDNQIEIVEAACAILNSFMDSATARGVVQVEP